MYGVCRWCCVDMASARLRMQVVGVGIGRGAEAQVSMVYRIRLLDWLGLWLGCVDVSGV